MTASRSDESSQLANPLSPAPEALNKPKLLLGEGKEEVLFFNEMLGNLGITDVQVEQYGGKSRLGDFLKTLTVRRGFSALVSVGVTRDADDDHVAAFQSVCGSLDRARLPKPLQAGTFTQDSPRIGVFLFPDNTQTGMLEDLCLQSVSSDFAMACVDEFIRCVERGGRIPKNTSKARVHAWLASQVVPDKRLGEAAQAGYWTWDSPAFEGFKQFLRSL